MVKILKYCMSKICSELRLTYSWLVVLCRCVYSDVHMLYFVLCFTLVFFEKFFFGYEVDGIVVEFCVLTDRFKVLVRGLDSLRRILGSYGGEYEDGCLLGCSAVQSGRSLPTFQR
jgi:hypothetical protein